MDTYLSEKEFIQGNMVQRVFNIDDAIGKSIITKGDFIITVDSNGNGLKEINLKEMIVKIEDVIRTGGLYLFCTTADNFTFALRPDELEQFEEISTK